MPDLAGGTIAKSIKKDLQTKELRDISATRVTRKHVKFSNNDGHHVDAASTSSSECSGSTQVERVNSSILTGSLGPKPTAPTMRSSLSRKGRSDQGSRNVQHNSATTEPYEPHGVVVKPSAGAKASYGNNGNGAGPRIASTSDGIGHKRDLNKTQWGSPPNVRNLAVLSSPWMKTISCTVNSVWLATKFSAKFYQGWNGRSKTESARMK